MRVERWLCAAKLPNNPCESLVDGLVVMFYPLNLDNHRSGIFSPVMPEAASHFEEGRGE